jgi:hypothetical protein
MLVILSGAETIKKTLLAATINASLNSLEPVGITQDQFYKDLLDRTIDNHYKMKFRAIMADYGIQETVLFPEGGNYNEFINRYNSRQQEHLVVSGSFSKTFVGMITKDISNVEVINVTRNPSVSYLLDTIAVDDRAPYNTNMNLKLLKKRYNTSTIQQVGLRSLSNVSTIKFEDILESGTVMVNKKSIPIPIAYSKFNKHITQREYSSIDACCITSDDIDKFNQAYSNFNLTFSNGRDDVPPAIIPKLPKNMFAELDYDPLTYNEILCPAF